MLVAIKPGIVVTYNKQLLSINPHEFLITWPSRLCDKSSTLYHYYHKAYAH